MMSKCLKITFFILWVILWIISTGLVTANVKWYILTDGQIVLGVLIVVFLSILHVGVTESLTMSIMTIFAGGKAIDEKKSDYSSLSVILNYNLLAMNKKDVNECYEVMYEAYMGNLGDNVSAVLLSATRDQSLMRYEKVYRYDVSI